MFSNNLSKEINTENNPPIAYSHTQTEKPIDNPNFFVIDKISNDYIANHIKKYYLFLIKCDFILNFNVDFLKPFHIETGFYRNTSLILLKR